MRQQASPPLPGPFMLEGELIHTMCGAGGNRPCHQARSPSKLVDIKGASESSLRHAGNNHAGRRKGNDPAVDHRALHAS